MCGRFRRGRQPGSASTYALPASSGLCRIDRWTGITCQLRNLHNGHCGVRSFMTTFIFGRAGQECFRTRYEGGCTAGRQSATAVAGCRNGGRHEALKTDCFPDKTACQCEATRAQIRELLAPRFCQLWSSLQSGSAAVVAPSWRTFFFLHAPFYRQWFPGPSAESSGAACPGRLPTGRSSPMGHAARSRPLMPAGICEELVQSRLRSGSTVVGLAG